MNRKQRRAATSQKRKLKVGDVVYAMTIENSGTGEVYWAETTTPENKTWPPPDTWHGPFKTEEEAVENSRLTLEQAVVSWN
jgi:hypothetical protein